MEIHVLKQDYVSLIISNESKNSTNVNAVLLKLDLGCHLPIYWLKQFCNFIIQHTWYHLSSEYASTAFIWDWSHTRVSFPKLKVRAMLYRTMRLLNMRCSLDMHHHTCTGWSLQKLQASQSTCFIENLCHHPRGNRCHFTWFTDNSVASTNGRCNFKC